MHVGTDPQAALTAEDARERHARAQLLGVRASQRRLIRLRHDFVRELPTVVPLVLEVNGLVAADLRTFDEALRELVVGWARMHGFLRTADEIDHCAVGDGHASLMVPSTDSVEDDSLGGTDVRCIDEDVLLGLLAVVWDTFRTNGLSDGFAQAALTRDDQVLCVSRDVDAELAVARVVGWMTENRADADLVAVHGTVDQRIVDGLARAGVPIIASGGLPTADAYRSAVGHDVSLIGMANMRSVGLLVDYGHIVNTDDIDLGVTDF